MRRLMRAIKEAKTRTTRYRTAGSRAGGGSLRSLAFEPELAKQRR